MKEINKKIEDALANYFIEANNEDIQEYLHTEVLDKEAYLQKKEKHLRKISFLSKAILNKQKDENLLGMVADRLHSILSNQTDRPIAFLKEMIQSNSIPAYYSNLDRLTREDIIEIIKDKNLIDILEKLGKDEDKY